jgi:hypothetical protein
MFNRYEINAKCGRNYGGTAEEAPAEEPAGTGKTGKPPVSVPTLGGEPTGPTLKGELGAVKVGKDGA